MIETLNKIRNFSAEARSLDDELIDGRASIVARNIMQIEGRGRSEKYVYRLAGHSPDVPIRSRTEQIVHWLGAAAMENAEASVKARAFFNNVFEYADSRAFIAKQDFWQVWEETGALISSVATKHMSGETGAERLLLTKIQQNVNLMLKMASAEEGVMRRVA